MASIEALDSRAGTVMRDIIHYAVPGLFLALLGLAPLVAGRARIPVSPALSQGFLKLVTYDTPATVAAVILFTVAAYLMGHVAFTSSFLVLAAYDRCCRSAKIDSLARRVRAAEQKLRQYREDHVRSGPAGVLLEGAPAHLYFEMRAFVELPELHAKFIERYNSLMHFSRTWLSACFLCGVYYLCVVTGVLGVAVGATLVLLSALVYRRYLHTREGFLLRVGAAYRIATERHGEAK